MLLTREELFKSLRQYAFPQDVAKNFADAPRVDEEKIAEVFKSFSTSVEQAITAFYADLNDTLTTDESLESFFDGLHRVITRKVLEEHALGYKNKLAELMAQKNQMYN